MRNKLIFPFKKTKKIPFLTHLNVKQQQQQQLIYSKTHSIMSNIITNMHMFASKVYIYLFC